MISSAPYRSHSRRSPALNVGSGGTTPMFAAAASVITAAMVSPRSAKVASTTARSLYGRTTVSAVAAAVTPGVSGRPRVATPDPAEASSAST
jgi:hypothetical protein